MGSTPNNIDEIGDAETKALLRRYLAVFRLEREPIWMTTELTAFQRRLGRRVNAAIGGAYVFQRSTKTHLVLINLPRIDRAQPRALEIVVAEELMHLRDWIDGDRRRHAKHGYDRIAVRVAELTGATMDEVRGCLLPVNRRPTRYTYRCPACRRTIERRRRGVWSCAMCSPKFDRRFVLELVADRGPAGAS